jgi:hypothetical protein
MQRCEKRTLLYMITMVATVPIAPVLRVVVLKLGREAEVSASPLLIGYTPALCYGYIASKIATERNVSTLIYVAMF